MDSIPLDFRQRFQVGADVFKANKLAVRLDLDCSLIPSLSVTAAPLLARVRCCHA